MRRIAVVMLLMPLLILVLLPGIQKTDAASGPRVIIVDSDGTGDFMTIQEAVNNASTIVKDMIRVHSGTYAESIVVNKSVSIVGESTESTIVDGRPAGGNVFYINGTGGGNEASIENFTIYGSGITSDQSAIRIVNSKDNNISGNFLASSSNGISLIFSRNNRISRNVVTYNTYGFYFSSSSGNLISNNNISGSITGIYMDASNNNNVTGNTITTNLIGTYIGYGYDNIVYHNNFDNVDINAQIGPVNGTNEWYCGGEGNYWQGHSGNDLNDDGIGETPYQVPAVPSGGGYDLDRYPLCGPFLTYTISFGNRDFETALISNSSISSFRFQLGAETANKLIRFAVSGASGSMGFCRLAVPNGLMPSPHIVLIDSEEVVPKQLNASSPAYDNIYFVYPNEGQIITVIYSDALHLYYELLGRHAELQADFAALNSTYYSLLDDYDALNAYYNELRSLNQELNETYNTLLTGSLALNASHYVLLQNYNVLLDNFSRLQTQVAALGLSYSELLKDYISQSENMRNMVYILAATTALLIVTTVYLSRRAYSGRPPKNRRGQDAQGGPLVSRP